MINYRQFLVTARRCVLATILLAPLILVLRSHTASAAQSVIEEQRRVFREVYPQAELGNWRPARQHEALLKRYVLWPDLRAAFLRTRIRHNDFDKIESFLDEYGTLKPARELRYRYALSLGRSGRLTRYYELYQQFYQGLEVAKLDCLAMQAELEAGRTSRIVNRGIEKWLTGRNQVVECDPVFDHLRDHGLLGEKLYRERFALAIAARQFAIARYLARSLPAGYRESARDWSAVVSDPRQFVERRKTSNISAEHRNQLLYAVERLAFKQPDVAASLWQEIEGQYSFSKSQRSATSRHIALWAARNHLDTATAQLFALSSDAVNDEVRAWQVRASLQRRDWRAVAATIDDMPDDLQQQEVWQYWLAAAKRTLGNRDAADLIFHELANERSFYGFLAADQVGIRYPFANSQLVADAATIEELNRQDAIVRARELFLVGLDSRGRSEWDAAVALLSRNEKLQASVLAHRWGWHSRAIATAASIGQYDDLDLRYPLPYRKAFEKYAKDSKIHHSWAYGVARSESLFMRDVRSSAGAIGLMQLMPETGRRTAKEFDLPYAGLTTLTNPSSNIQLGTVYLRKLLQQFDDNPVLATAAYNAGPRRVKDWLPEDGEIDALIWIENIPFNETRKYVRRVLSADSIFHWRLTGKIRRLSPELIPISAAPQPQRVAKTD